MISYGKQSIDQSDIDALIEVLESDWLTQGPAVEKFENDLNNYFGSKYCCAVSNGTAALHLVGLALGWEPGDIIITTPITFLATVNCIVYSGAIPDFVDIDTKTYTLEPNQLEEKIKYYHLNGKKVKAVIGVDFAGHPCDWKTLREIADKYEIQLINDNCHALGASYYNDKKYAVKYADVVTQSYHPVKHITTGEGGSIITNKSLIDNKVKLLRTHGMEKNNNQLKNNEDPWYYEMHIPGYNYRVTDLQCALGSSQLKKLSKFVYARQQIASRYDKAFSNINSLIIPQSQDNILHAYHLYPLQIDFQRIGLSKSELFKKMKEFGINLQVHYIPVHLQPFYSKMYGFEKGDFPISEEFYEKEVSLPIYPNLKEGDVSKVINSLLELVTS